MSIEERISGILEMENADSEMLEAVEAFNKWERVRKTREKYQEMLDSSDREPLPKEDLLKWNTPRMQKIFEG